MLTFKGIRGGRLMDLSSIDAMRVIRDRVDLESHVPPSSDGAQLAISKEPSLTTVDFGRFIEYVNPNDRELWHPCGVCNLRITSSQSTCYLCRKRLCTECRGWDPLRDDTRFNKPWRCRESCNLFFFRTWKSVLITTSSTTITTFRFEEYVAHQVVESS